VTNCKNQSELRTGNGDIDSVKEYKYLRRIMSFEEGMNNEMKARREAAWKSYWTLENILNIKERKYQ